MGYIRDALDNLDTLNEKSDLSNSIYNGYKKKQKKSEKGGAWGWFQKNAGIPEYNMWRFNHMYNDETAGKDSKPVEAETAAEAGNDGIGGKGGLVMGGETVASADAMAGIAGAGEADGGIGAVGGMGESLETPSEDDFDPLAHDAEFRYQLLSRCISDCKYYIQHPHDKHLWAGNKEDQHKLMIALYNSFPDDAKPEWTSIEEIDDLFNKMQSLNESFDKIDSLLTEWDEDEDPRYDDYLASLHDYDDIFIESREFEDLFSEELEDYIAKNKSEIWAEFVKFWNTDMDQSWKDDFMSYFEDVDDPRFASPDINEWPTDEEAINSIFKIVTDSDEIFYEIPFMEKVKEDITDELLSSDAFYDFASEIANDKSYY